MKKRCALYIRSSELEQTSELQLIELQEYANSRDFQVVKVYEDWGVGPVERREDLAKMIGAAKMDKFDFILTWRLDRMFCSHKHLWNTIQEIHALGVGVISVRDEVDTFSKDGALIQHMFSAFNNFHARIMAERAQAGINGQKRRGYFGKWPKVDRKEMVRLAEEGLTQKEIAKRLNCSTSVISVGLRKSRHPINHDNTHHFAL